MKINESIALPAFDRQDPLGAAARLLDAFSPLWAATVGLDGRPQLRTAVFAFAREGALYCMTAKNCRFYAELCKTPYVQLSVRDPETEASFRLSGKVCFTEDDAILERFIREKPEAFDKLGGDPKTLIAFFLLEARAELWAEGALEPELDLRLPDPAGVLVGITIKKKTELRDRIAKVLERREAEPPAEADESAKLLDGAFFVFAEAAKALWPRMDIRPIERAACFETWDERERYTKLAAELIGNAVIDKPEDISYWLSPDTLNVLRERRG